MTFEVFALICTLGQSPSECIPQTARAVEKIGEGSSELECQRWGALSLPHGAKIGENEYPKVMCLRKK